MRFVIALRSRDYPVPTWLLRVFQVGFALWFGLAGMCIMIILYACASLALGLG